MNNLRVGRKIINYEKERKEKVKEMYRGKLFK